LPELLKSISATSTKNGFREHLTHIGEANGFHKDALAQVARREYVRPSKKTVLEEANDWYERKAAGEYRRASLWTGKTI
jgi:hypothetical protein